METTTLTTLAIRRVLGIEKKSRKQAIYYIEEEIKEIMSVHHLAPSDFSNLALQEYIHNHGIPILLLSLQPEGMIMQHPNQSDIMNLALSELLEKKGYLPDNKIGQGRGGPAPLHPSGTRKKER